MWQRFTERARKTIFYAQEEAQRFGAGYVSTEQLLLGLLREPDNVACFTFDRLGLDLGRIRSEVEGHTPRDNAQPRHDMTLTPRAKMVIDLAYKEAKWLNNNYIGTEHLLLGMIAEREGLAAWVLTESGATLESARQTVIELQNEGKSQGHSSGTAAGQSAVSKFASSVGPDSLAMMLLGDPPESLVAAFDLIGTSPVLVSAAIRKALVRQDLSSTPDIPSIRDFLDAGGGAFAIFARIARHKGTVTHQVLVDLGCTEEAIEASFPA